MSENIKHIIDSSAIGFLEKFVAAVKQEFYLSGLMEHYPSDHLLKEVILFKDPEKPLHKKKMKLVVKEVHCMDRLDFLKQVQQAIIEGFEPDLETLYWGVSKQVFMVPIPEPEIELPPSPEAPEQPEEAPAMESPQDSEESVLEQAVEAPVEDKKASKRKK